MLALGNNLKMFTIPTPPLIPLSISPFPVAPVPIYVRDAKPTVTIEVNFVFNINGNILKSQHVDEIEIRRIPISVK